MDKREILSKGQDLQKALSSNEPAVNIINILSDLKKNIKPTEELLRATGIGKTVNKARMNKDPEVARLGSEIVNKWRHMVNEQKLATGGTSTPNGQRANGTSSPAPGAKPSKPIPKAAAPAGVPPDKRSWKTDNVPRDKLTDDPARNNVIGLFYDGLAPGEERPMLEILDMAKAIEAAALAKFQSANKPEYREKCRSLFQNLKSKSNPYLRKKMFSGKITPERLVVMSHEDLKSKEQREEDAKLHKENMDKAMVAQEVKSVSTALECGKCHQKKVSYTQAQTRSADEPMTTFCECLNCGNRWKFS